MDIAVGYTHLGMEVGMVPKDWLGGMWYEDHLGPGRLEARADETVRPMTNPVSSAGHWAASRTVQGNPVPTRVCVWMMIVPEQRSLLHGVNDTSKGTVT